MEADLAAVEASRSNSRTASRIDPAELADLEGSLYRYNKAVWPIIEGGHPYVDGWHIGCVCEHLQAMLELQINNLIINIPPRHGKSVAGAVSWFTWGWARQPSLRWMYSSYADNLVVRDANASRRLIESTWYQDRWGHKVQFGRKNTDEWFENTATGYRISTTVGGKALGHGADILVTDDPMKALDARSAAERLRIIEWWTKTMSTRINDPKKVRKVIIMQRLHEADLSGYLSARGEGYEVLVLPAEYEPKRVFIMRPDPKPRDAIIMTKLQRERPECRDPRTMDGELLWPERFGRKEIDALKIELEADGVAGQLQQRPSPADGTVFQRPHFRYAAAASTTLGPSYILYGPDGKEAKRVQIARCRFIQTVDTAVKAKQNNDPTAVGTFAITPDGDLIIIHMVAERIEIPYQLAFLKAMRPGPAAWVKSLRQIIPAAVRWPRPLLGQWIEDAASGTMLLATGGITEGIAFRLLKHGGKDKVQRAAPLSALYQAGRVYHLRGQAWLTKYEDEISVFPAGTHDDMCLVAGTMVQTRRGSVAIEAVTTADWVATRRGWRRVQWSGVTGYRSPVLRVELSDGRSITGTGSHPVWVVGRGWVRIDSLAYGDRMLSCRQESKRSNSKVGCIGDIRTPNTGIIGCITSATIDGRQRRGYFTETSGNRLTARYRMGATFTTKTTTQTTMRLQISCASHLRNTSVCTPSQATGERQPFGLIWSGFVRLPRRGILPKLVKSFIGSMASGQAISAKRMRLRWFAKCVEWITGRCTRIADFVRRSVRRSIGVIRGLMTNCDRAVSVPSCLRSIGTPKPSDAPHVVRVVPVGQATVYNLTVDGEHEFFANGILTHNCDCAAYAARVALYDELVRAGLSGLDEVAADYANPEADPDDPGAVRRPWTLAPGETLDTMPEPEIVVSLGDDDAPAAVVVRDGAAPVGWRDPAAIPGLPTPPPAPEGDWPEILFDKLRDAAKPPTAPPDPLPLSIPDDDIFSLE